MTNHIEYVVAGGPQHGALVELPAQGPVAWCKQMICSDGGTYTVAACRNSPSKGRMRFVLLHSRATGEQFLAMLAKAARSSD